MPADHPASNYDRAAFTLNRAEIDGDYAVFVPNQAALVPDRAASILDHNAFTPDRAASVPDHDAFTPDRAASISTYTNSTARLYLASKARAFLRREVCNYARSSSYWRTF